MVMNRVSSSSSSVPSKGNETDSGDASVRTWWKFRLRPYNDDEDEDWWFASTGIPLLAATSGPLANVTSIAALVSTWRMSLIAADGSMLPEFSGIPIKDPSWVYWPNVASLICGFLGNIFLMFNFTGAIRYIVALPVTIILWYLSSAILIGITLSNDIYLPPIRPQQTYTQGFWYAVISAVLYTFSSMILMVNMLGYLLGHYPQRFNLTDHQRNLILQTILFNAWLAAGGAIFSAADSFSVEKTWTFADGLYFSDVTILTVGFGDLVPNNDVSRGLVLPYSMGGIIMLGLMASSLHRFAKELSHDNVVQHHVERQRVRTVGRAVATSLEMRRTLEEAKRPRQRGSHWETPPLQRASTFGYVLRRTTTLASIISGPVLNQVRKPKMILLREEKDRFCAMRKIQDQTQTFKRWYALTLSVIAFALLWCLGALVFYYTEQNTLQLTYFQSLYFCYVSLITIGYGDFAPKSNAGRAFFVVWSLLAVPTMTILISDMGDTVISNFKQGTFVFADFTLLPKSGKWRHLLNKHPWLLGKLERRQQHQEMRDAEKVPRPSILIPSANNEDDAEDAAEAEEALQAPSPTLEKLAEEMSGEPKLSEHDLARRLALAIRRTAHDLREDKARKYSYEEWVDFTRLIRFSSSKYVKRKADRRVRKNGSNEGMTRRKSSAGPRLQLALFQTAAERRPSRTDRKNSEGGDPDETEGDEDASRSARRKSSAGIGFCHVLFQTDADRRASHAPRRSSEGGGPEPLAASSVKDEGRDGNASGNRDNDEDEDDDDDDDDESEDEGLIEWDWLGEESPMMGELSEPEFVLDRLTESIARYIRRQVEAGTNELGSR